MANDIAPVSTPALTAPPGGVRAGDYTPLVRPASGETAASLHQVPPLGVAKAFPIPLVAGAAILGKRALMIGADGRAVHADPGYTDYQFAGFSVTGAAVGATFQSEILGIVENPTWPWTPGRPLYVYPGGVLEHTPPTSGIVHRVGIAMSATSLLIVNETPAKI